MKEDLKKVCQNCKRHKNNPSKCNLKNEFVGRKNTCNDFKSK